MSDLPPVSIPVAGVNLIQLIRLITAINKTLHDDLQVSTSMAALEIQVNDLASVRGVPVIDINVNVQTSLY